MTRWIALSILLIAAVLVLTVSPATAATRLPMGVINTSPWVYAALPNQMGMDDMPLHNLTESGIPFYIGSAIYPPLYESNPDIIPWEIWIFFAAVAFLGVFGSFAYPKPEGQMVASILGLMAAAYDFILSSMIGFTSVTSNPGAMTLNIDQAAVGVMVNIVQPVYTVYNPPWLWVLLLLLVFAAIFGFLNATYNIITRVNGEKLAGRVRR